MALTFWVQDRQNRDRASSLAGDLRAAGLIEASRRAEVELLIVHRNTDAPGKRGGVSREEETAAIENGVFVEYTGGVTPWTLEGENHIYCAIEALHERLRSLQKPVTVEQLRSVLLATEESTLEVLPALAILCQGFLAVHAVYDEGTGAWEPPETGAALNQMGWAEVMTNSSLLAVLPPDLGNRKSIVAKAKWWLEVFGYNGDLESQVNELKQQVNKEWAPDSETDEPAKVSHLLDDFQEQGERSLTPGWVAGAFVEIAERLGRET